jgi:cell division protein DivIC
MKKYLQPFRNKYILTITLFLIYNLFLDDVDLFSLLSQNRKLSRLRTDQSEVMIKLQETKKTLRELKHGYALEKYAREEKLFKKDDEDVFIVTYE